MKLEILSRDLCAQFEKRYGRPPRWIAAAPGRVNLIGEHIDYNDGFVLPMAIEFYTLMAADRPTEGGTLITIESTLEPEPAVIDLSAPVTPSLPKWGNYTRGVVNGFLARGINPGGLEVLVHSTVPLGSGLSSSAALEVAAATLLEAVTGERLDPVEKALLAQKAEHDFAGVPCGIMDQFISVMGQEGHLLLLDCRTHQSELVPMNDPSVELLIINTQVKHELSSGEYAKRREECQRASEMLGATSLREVSLEQLETHKEQMPEAIYRRARHVVSEIHRTLEAVGSARSGDWCRVGSLLYASHRSLRDDYEVSCMELDFIVDIAYGIGLDGGVFGCRMTGGGFGGCAVALVRADAAAAISKEIASEYKARTGIDAGIYSSRPAAGAVVLRP